MGCIQKTVALCFSCLMFEGPFIIYANEYGEVTSSTPLPPISDLPEGPVALQKELFGCSFKERFYKACPGLSQVQ